jgi:hypothetical protein
LVTENGGNGLDRVTALRELLSEWIIGQCLARLLFIVSKGIWGKKSWFLRRNDVESVGCGGRELSTASPIDVAPSVHPLVA